MQAMSELERRKICSRFTNLFNEPLQRHCDTKVRSFVKFIYSQTTANATYVKAPISI